MNEPDLEISDDRHDSLLEALARTPDVQPFIGTERYRVRRCLGEGGFGVVYEVEDVQLGRCLALKTLRPERTGFSANIRRLKREFRSVADLVHPNLVALHELCSEGARWFFTMDLVRGHDFFEYVRGETAAAYAHTAKAADAPPRRDTSGILSESRLRASLRQLVAGVGALHQAGIIHRDLKPSNVLVEPEGRVVILDFGLAGGEVHADPEMSVDLAGTPAYMAPEQATGDAVTAAADWYAVGVMLYEALTGELPFADGGDVRMMHAKCTRDPAPPSSHARVPADLERLCLALLARKAETRPAARAILEALGDATPARADSQQAAARAAFVGRDQDLAALRDAYAAVRRGEPRLVRIHGEPGVGKSALVGRFIEELREQGDAAVLAGRCYEREAVPFKAFDGIADALVRYLRALPRREASALMPRDVHLVTQLFPVLDGVAAVRDVPRRQAAQVDPRAARQRAFAALKELIARIADKQPLVVAIDDLQWGDVDSARLLAQLVGPADRPGVMLVLSHRTAREDDATLREMLRMLDAAGDPGQEIRLRALTEDDALDLATRLLGAAGASAAAARAIASRGEGHPLLMAELARALLSKGSSDAGAPTLIDILWQRVVRLSESSRALLETVAVAGQPLASGLCFEAAGLDASGADAVRALRAEQLIVTSDTGAINVFHDRIRDAVLARAGVDTRRMRHLALARTLERRPDADPETLARHFDAADEQEQAGQHALRAGDAAMRALAFDRAAALYRMAIDRGMAQSSVHEKLGDALLSAGSNADAGEAYLSAAAHADGAHAVRLTARAAGQLLSVGRLAAGRDAIAQALAAVGEKLPGSRGKSILEAIWHLVRMRLGGFRSRERAATTIAAERLLRLDVLEAAASGLMDVHFASAFGIMMRFCRMSLRTGEPRRAAMALILATMAIEGNSRPAQIDSLLDRAEAIATRLSDSNLRAKAMRLRATSYYLYGDPPRARELANSAAALISERCAGMGIDLRFLRMVEASMDVDLGELARARELVESQLLDAVERRDPVAERGLIICVLVPLCLAADDPSRAAEYLERAKDEDRCANLLFSCKACASLAMYLGRPRDAVDLWRSRWDEIEGEGVLRPPGFRLAAVRSFGMALLSEPAGPGELREAARLAARIRRLAFPLAEANHLTLRAYLVAHRGQREEAIALLRGAAERFARAGLRLEAAALLHRAGDDDAREVLHAGGIADPERWAAMVAPPLPSRRLTV